MTIDPRWSFWLSLVLAILGFLSGATAQFTSLGLPATTVAAIMAIIALLLGIGNAINAVLAAIPSKDKTTGFYLGPKSQDPSK